MDIKYINVIDLFAGCGGLSCGLVMSGCNVVAALDFDKYACRTYRTNFQDHTIIEGDITLDATKQRLYDTVGDKKVDCIFAGFPCQSFSMAGLRLDDDPRNFLYREFIDVVKHFRPDFIVAENVKGFMTKQKGIYPIMLKQEFAEIGYKVDVKVLNAADYGVPQLRERTIIIGNRLGIDNIFPTPVVDKHNRITVSQAIGDLMDMPEDQIFGQIYTRHMVSTRQRMSDVKEHDHMYKSRNSAWRKLPWNEPAFTMTENHGAPAIHPIRQDMITPREMARLQSFPDTFRFSCVSKTQTLKQIGNAVPPLLGKAIGQTIIKMAQERDFEQ